MKVKVVREVLEELGEYEGGDGDNGGAASTAMGLATQEGTLDKVNEGSLLILVKIEGPVHGLVLYEVFRVENGKPKHQGYKYWDPQAGYLNCTKDQWHETISKATLDAMQHHDGLRM